MAEMVKKSMEKMGELLPNVNHQALQHFLTNSPWDERPLLEKIAKDSNKLLGGRENSCLVIDETSFPKKGAHSVGAARQLCGRLGKRDVCQVAVFSALICDNKSLPLDFRLYLPEEWTDDVPRCLKTGIPPEKIKFKTKIEQAIELVETAKKNRVQFSWVAADAFYGCEALLK